ncbi:O-antigen ligase family protein [Helicovermis profundi]|uniref:O-antigen ligase-related domain-containing protein n=1 Tax=Helicovermis profundi TaxID=3065157 RepID=A0AAU9EQC3_9FIRM|nr:hypothetical protein HLPR_27050 [Clostridia bacterium S502]
MKKNKEAKWIYYIPIFTFLYSVLVIAVKKVTFDFTSVTWMEDKKIFIDLFAYYKAQLIIFSAILAIIIMLHKYIKGQITVKIDYKKYIPYFMFTFFIVLSYLMSEHKDIALYGFFDRYEGLLVYLSYIIMTLYIAYVLKNKKINISIIVRMLMVLTIILGVLGTLQYLGKDIFRMDWFKNYIVSFLGKNSKINFTMPKDRVYLTVYNPNYVGVVMAMLITLSLNVIILSKDKINKILALVSLPLALVTLVGSYSRAGMFAIVLGLIVIIIVNAKNIIKNKYVFVLAMLILIGSIVGINSHMNGFIENRFMSIFNVNKYSYTKLMDLKTNNDSIIVNYDGVSYKFLMQKHSPVGLVYEEGEKKVLPKFKNKTYYFDRDVVKNMNIAVGKYRNSYFWQFTIDGHKWNFTPTSEGIKYINGVGKLSSAEAALYWKPLKGYERLASGRGYIWSRSIPLIKNTIIKGYGPDTFALAFPQEDYVYKSKFLANTNMVVDKPHSMYLQYIINFGLLAFLSYLTLTGIILTNIFRKKEVDRYKKSVIITSVIVISVVMLTNDSTVSSGPLMWTLFAIGQSEV